MPIECESGEVLEAERPESQKGQDESVPKHNGAAAIGRERACVCDQTQSEIENVIGADELPALVADGHMAGADSTSDAADP